MANIFSLYGSIFIDNEKANKSIDETTQKGKKSSTSIADAVGKIGGGVAKVGGLVATGATAAVGAITYMADKTGEYAGSILDASRKTSISTDMLQQLKYAGEQSGVEFEALTGSATKFNKVFANAVTGNKAGIETFKNLGIAIKDSNGNARSSSDVYNDVIMKLASMGDTAEANALGNDIFGKSFANLKPLLAEGSDGIEAFKQQAKDLGIVMSEDAVKAGDDFSDSIASLQASLGGLLNQILGSVMPIIQPIIDGLIANMPMIQSGISQFVPIVTGFFSAILPPLMNLAQQLFPVILNLIQQLMPFMTQIISIILPILSQLLAMLLPPIIEIVQALLPIFIQLLTPLLPLLQPLLAILQPFIDLLMAIIRPLLQILNAILPPLITVIKAFLNVWIPAAQAMIGIFVGAVTNWIGSIVNYFKNQFNVVKNIFFNIIDFIRNVFTGNWRGAWENVVNIFSNIFSGIANQFKLPLNIVIGGINSFLSAINRIDIPDWVPSVGGRGFNIPLIPRLRVGMEYVPYDEMPAVLHKGETVLDKDEAEEYRKGKNNTTQNVSNSVNNIFNIEKIEVKNDNDIKRIAEELYYMQKKEALA